MNKKLLSALCICAGLAVFALGYAVLNERLLVSSILYRWAASDVSTALANLLGFAVQAVLLLAVFLLTPRPVFLILLGLVVLSGVVNTVHQDILHATLTTASLEWMMGETRQLGSAAAEFSAQFLIGCLKVAGAALLFLLARKVLRPQLTVSGPINALLHHRTTAVLAVVLLVCSDFVLARMHVARGAEMNVYSMMGRIMFHETPQRLAVQAEPEAVPLARKIVWLVDESIAWKNYDTDLRPQWASAWNGIDYGKGRSLSNCSAQSNASLRWGVGVKTITPNTDLRTNSSIWAYAKKAGYRTVLIDGQVRLGEPQNYLWANERALIDEVQPAAAGFDTDRLIAGKLNGILRSAEQQFVYVVLKGAHYQYHGNYPEGKDHIGLPIEEQYRRAVAYSKKAVMETLFADVDRSEVAVFYTSDHGQHIEAGQIPHCKEKPHPDELAVPMMLFSPERHRAAFQPEVGKTGASQSQIFPTTLTLMGYARSYAEETYDNAFPKGTQRVIRLGKKIFPSSDDKQIEVFFDEAAALD